MKPSHISILLAVLCGACSPGYAPDEVDVEEPAAKAAAASALPVRDLLPAGPEVTREQAAGALIVLARIGTGPHDYVEWSRFAGAHGTADVGVSVTFPNRPLLTSSFLAAHSAMEAFLAVAPLDMPVPGALAERGTAHGPQDVSPARRRALAAELASQLASVPLPGTNVRRRGAATCTNAFKTWVSGVYGEDGTCGKQTRTADYTREETYCAYGTCTFKLPASGIAECDAQAQWGLKLEACDLLSGTLGGVKGRVVDWRGDASWTHGGHRVHTGVANCTGNGDVKYVETRGSFSATHLVPENGMLHYFRGPGVKRPKTSWAYGSWHTSTHAGGRTYETCKLDVTQNSGSQDLAIACVDWEVSYGVSDRSYGGCHGANVDLCTSDCDTACFDIDGY